MDFRQAENKPGTPDLFFAPCIVFYKILSVHLCSIEKLLNITGGAIGFVPPVILKNSLRGVRYYKYSINITL